MKKTLCLFLVALLSLGSALAASPDYSAMTDDELLSAYKEIRTEMQSRDLTDEDEITLREGKYIIGQDIAVGDYTITCTGTEGETTGSAYGSLGSMLDSLDDDSSDNWSKLYGSLGSVIEDEINLSVKILGDYGDVLKYYEMKKGDSMTIVLKEGTALQLLNGSCTLIPLS